MNLQTALDIVFACASTTKIKMSKLLNWYSGWQSSVTRLNTDGQRVYIIKLRWPALHLTSSPIFKLYINFIFSSSLLSWAFSCQHCVASLPQPLTRVELIGPDIKINQPIIIIVLLICSKTCKSLGYFDSCSSVFLIWMWDCMATLSARSNIYLLGTNICELPIILQ